MSDQTALAKAKSQTTKAKRGGDGPKASLNMDELRELAELVNEHGFTDFEFENENIRVRLSKTAPAQIVAAPAVHAAPVAAPVAATAPVAADSAQAEPASEDDSLIKIPSPIVGTFYRAPGPDKDPYVKEGDSVSENTVVCIVEAMKLMNEIQAETSGVVAKIYVENGQPVEYGQPLFGIKK